MPSTGGKALRQFDVLPNREGSIRFTPDGQGVAHAVTDEHGVGNIWGQPLGGDPAKALTDFKADKIFDSVWWRDGRKLAVSRGRTSRDVGLCGSTTRTGDCLGTLVTGAVARGGAKI